MHIQGQLSKFRGDVQIRVENAWLETDPLAESLHWVRHGCHVPALRAVTQEAAPRCPNSPQRRAYARIRGQAV
jgi:hypothetical protein